MKEYVKTFLLAILAGLCIGLGGNVFLALASTSRLLGAFLFTVGLFTICIFGFALFTGRVCSLFDNPPKYIVTLIVISIGGLMRYTRTNMLEVLNADYIRTARAKGLSERKVIYHHAFRNTLIPLVTIVGGSLPGLFSGALFTETMFSIPGIGYTSYQAMIAGDIPFSMFYLAFLSILTLLGNLIADILYAVVDPRVRIA